MTRFVVLALVLPLAWPLIATADTEPIGYWPFDGNAENMVPNMSLSEVQSVTYVTGFQGQAAHFDGQESSIWILSPQFYHYTFGLSSQGFTVMCWARAEMAESDELVIREGKIGNSSDYDLRLDPIAGAVFSESFNRPFVGCEGYFDLFTATAVVPELTDRWHHLAVTYELTGSPHGTRRTRLFLDGILRDQRNFDEDTKFCPNNDGLLAVGAGLVDGGGATMHFAGDIDELFVFKATLDPLEVARRAGVCWADCDGSGGLDLFDFLCFTNLFNEDDPRADCTGDYVLGFFDFLCYVNAFNAGC